MDCNISLKGGDPSAGSPTDTLLRLSPSQKSYRSDSSLRTKTPSGITFFRDLTGGEYKAQEHIHRIISDIRLLAIPTSCRRVSACNPNWDRFLGLAPSRDFATFCIGHCSTGVALDIRAMLIWRHPYLPPGCTRQSRMKNLTYDKGCARLRT